MMRLEEAIAVGNHSEAARLAKEVSKVIFCWKYLEILECAWFECMVNV
jgi:hypothetical protein